MTMRERIARAICQARYERESLVGIIETVIERDLYVDKRWSEYESQADAVLAAMREPTPEMIMAGIIERHDAETPEAWKLATAHIYTAMIDAARAPSS